MNKSYIKQEKIRFRHIDYAGIVFYPRYLEMLNDLVEDWFEEALERPFSKMHQTGGIPTVDLKIQFKKPARLGEILTKKLWVISIGKSSILCAYKFENQTNEVILEGEVTLVNIAISEDRNAIKANAFTDDIIEKIMIYKLE